MMTPNDTHTGLLVVGDARTAPDAAFQAKGRLVVFLRWEDHVAFADASPGNESAYLEMDAARREIEVEAFELAGAAAHAAVRALKLPRTDQADVAQAARRVLQHETAYAAARARRTAAEIVALADGRPVDAVALDEFTAAYLEAACSKAGVALVRRATREENAAVPLVPGLDRPWARVAVNAVRRMRRGGARSAARRQCQALAREHGRVVAYVSQAARDESIAGPAVERIRATGAAVVKIDLSRDGRVLDTGYPADLVLDGRAWLDPYPVGAFLRYVTRRRSAIAELVRELPDTVDPIREVFAAWTVRAAGLTAPSVLSTTGSLLDDVHPERVVVLGETNRLVEPLAISARRRDVPITCVQHGIIHAIAQWAEMPFSTFAVYGPAYSEVLFSMGTLPERLKVVGDPRLDTIAERDPADRDEIVAKLRPFVRGAMPSDPFVVLFAANYATKRLSGESMERTFRVLAEGLAHVPDAVLVVKLHPQGAGKELPYERALRDGLPVPTVVAPRDTPLLELIDAADAVAIHVSSVGFEAAALRTPVVVVKTDDGIQEIPFVAEGIAAEARTPAEVTEAFERIRAGRATVGEAAYHEFDERYHYVLDGRASERLAEAIEDSSW